MILSEGTIGPKDKHKTPILFMASPKMSVCSKSKECFSRKEYHKLPVSLTVGLLSLRTDFQLLFFTVRILIKFSHFIVFCLLMCQLPCDMILTDKFMKNILGKAVALH
jgi:hypothetical protein